MPFVELGAEVTAVDDSPAQLARLRERAGDRVETIEADAEVALAFLPADYDVVVASSFLHHVPDYLGFLDRTLGHARARAVFLSFQDPLLYASLPRPTRTYAALSYDAWRLVQGDVRARESAAGCVGGAASTWTPSSRTSSSTTPLAEVSTARQ